MANIYSAPHSIIPKPVFKFSDIKGSREAEEKYLEDLKALCLERNKGKNVGEILRFPFADSHAIYMVASMKPLNLIHLDIGDAWEFPYIERLTAADIQQKIDSQNAMAKLFSKK